MLKKLILTSLLTSAALYADIIGGEVSVGIYSHSPSGSASYTLPYLPLNESIDLENDLGWDSKQDAMVKAYFELPLPFVPNVKLAYSNFNQSGDATVTSFSWGDIIGLDGTINTSLELQMYDLTAYYELLDNVVEIDAGLTLRYLNGNMDVTPTADFNLPGFIPDLSVSAPQSTDIDMWIPLVYGKARFNIPTTDISLQIEGNGITYQDTTFYDYELSARYTFSMGLGLEAGYKSTHIDSEDLADGLVVDVDSSGPYAAVVWDF
ncbi:MAG TPA: TIGR04219 family outer membrane beta-barrel protein [Epsilonproteobacteria bacterium]|nr:TIGR04219 family outer membrane beta-barrel protein [Campylobacterota bacterium]